MLLDFMQEAQLDRVGCFQYSPVEGAAANALANQVPDEVKQERFERFMELQSDISYQKLQAKRGKTIRILIDDYQDEQWIARSASDAPEIDGLVYLPQRSNIKIGEFHDVKIMDSDHYDLFGEWI